MADLNDIERRLVAIENSLDLKRPLNQGIEDPSFPTVENLVALNVTQNDFNTSVVLTWTDIEDHPDVESYEIFQFFKDKAPKHLETVRAAPVPLTVQANEDGVVIVGVRAKFRGGVGNDYLECPVTAIPVTKPSVTAASLADNAVTTTKIANAAVTTAKIGNAQITNALIANLAVDNAKINDLAATKITAGTLAAGVIYANAIAASQILAGTINVALALTAPNITSTSGSNVISLNNGVLQVTGSVARTTLAQGEISSTILSGSSDRTFISGGTLDQLNPAGTHVLALDGFGFVGGQANSGRLSMRNSSGTLRVNLGTSSADNGVLGLTGVGGTAATIQAGSSSTAGVYFGGLKVIGVRQTDPGASPTTEQLRQVLLAHGLI